MINVLESQANAASPIVLLQAIDVEIRNLYAKQYFERQWSPELERQREILKNRRIMLIQSL